MIVKMSPHFWSKQLYAGIKGGSRGDNHGQQRRVKGGYIVEMHNFGIATEYGSHEIGDGYDADDQQEYQQVHI